MTLFLNLLLLIAGFFILIKGADLFVDGSCNVAKLLRVPTIIIGLTIVSIGTSAPEAAVSISAAVRGANEIALSNVIGSNMFNLLVVVGICALIKPIAVSKSLYKRDFPLCILFTIVVAVLIYNKKLSLLDGIILLVLFIGFITLLIRSALSSRVPEQSKEEIDSSKDKPISPLKSFILIAIGLAGIVLGGEAVVRSSTVIASICGMSDTLIGLTIIACGTSLPELVTSIVAARKGENDLALGNVVGSNIFNLLFILGLSATIHPIAAIQANIYDIIILALVTLTYYILVWTKKTVTRFEGFLSVAVYVGYMVYIILRN